MWGSFMLLMLLLALGCKFVLFLKIEDGNADDLGNRILFAILYWWLTFVVVPRWRAYSIEEEVEVLSDGTSITKLVNVKEE